VVERWRGASHAVTVRDLTAYRKSIVQLGVGNADLSESSSMGELLEMPNGLVKMGWSFREVMYVGAEESSCDELLVEVARLEREEDTCVRDVSHGLRVLELVGESVLELLGFVCNLELTRQAVPGVLRTRIADVDGALALFSLAPQRVWLLVDRSHGEYLDEVLASVSDELGR